MKCFYCTGEVNPKHFVSVEQYDESYRVRRPFCDFHCLSYWIQRIVDPEKGQWDFESQLLTFVKRSTPQEVEKIG